MPNVGKSQILASCTSANPEISSTPYSTQKARIGMLNYENIQFQLIDRCYKRTMKRCIGIHAGRLGMLGDFDQGTAQMGALFPYGQTYRFDFS